MGCKLKQQDVYQNYVK